MDVAFAQKLQHLQHDHLEVGTQLVLFSVSSSTINLFFFVLEWFGFASSGCSYVVLLEVVCDCEKCVVMVDV